MMLTVQEKCGKNSHTIFSGKMQSLMIRRIWRCVWRSCMVRSWMKRGRIVVLGVEEISLRIILIIVSNISSVDYLKDCEGFSQRDFLSGYHSLEVDGDILNMENTPLRALILTSMMMRQCLLH